MSHITKEEYLSAFLDGEAGSFEHQRLCDQLETDELMREKFSDYALIGEAVRNEKQSQNLVADVSFLAGIQDAIAEDEVIAVTDESATVIPSKVAKRSIFPKQALGYAVAASVAAIATISIQNYFSPQQQSGMVAQAPVSTPVNVNAAIMTASMGTKQQAPVQADTLSYRAPDAETRGLMNKYIAHHLQYASSTTLMPSVRAVSYSSDF